MKELKRVSRWISVNCIYVTEKHSLYYYGDKYSEENGKRPVMAFKWNGRLYAVGQFISRWGMFGFDQQGKEYPKYICGYDGEGDIFNPLLIEIDEYGDKVRLYIKI